MPQQAVEFTRWCRASSRADWASLCNHRMWWWWWQYFDSLQLIPGPPITVVDLSLPEGKRCMLHIRISKKSLDTASVSRVDESDTHFREQVQKLQAGDMVTDTLLNIWLACVSLFLSLSLLANGLIASGWVRLSHTLSLSVIGTSFPHCHFLFFSLSLLLHLSLSLYHSFSLSLWTLSVFTGH
jgi:hypothetical protein